VLSAGLMDCHALAGNCNGTGIRFPGRPDTVGDPKFDIGIHWASSAYFRTMKIPSSKAACLPTPTARIRLRWRSSTKPARAVFGRARIHRQIDRHGVSRLRRSRGGGRGGRRCPLWPVGRGAGTRRVYFVFAVLRSDFLLSIRTASHPTAVLEAVRHEVHELNRDLPLYDVSTMEERIRDASSRARFSAAVLAAFAAIALLLSGIGIYGVMSYVVRQRTREIGIRMALGARAEDVRKMILSRTAGLVAAGTAIGLAGALVLTRVLESLLYQVKPNDPQTYVAVSAYWRCWLCWRPICPRGGRAQWTLP